MGDRRYDMMKLGGEPLEKDQKKNMTTTCQRCVSARIGANDTVKYLDKRIRIEIFLCGHVFVFI